MKQNVSHFHTQKAPLLGARVLLKYAQVAHANRLMDEVIFEGNVFKQERVLRHHWIKHNIKFCLKLL